MIPFLLMLAAAGFLMLVLTTYRPETGERLALEPASAIAAAPREALPFDAQTAAAIAAMPGGEGWSEYVAAYGPANLVLVTVTGPEVPVVAVLGPVAGAALRQTSEGTTWDAWLETIHGTLLLGILGERLIEVAAGGGEHERHAPLAQRLGQGEHQLAAEIDVQDGGVGRGFALKQRQGVGHGGHRPQHRGAGVLHLVPEVLGQQVLVLDHQDAEAAEGERGSGNSRGTQGNRLRHVSAPRRMTRAR